MRGRSTRTRLQMGAIVAALVGMALAGTPASHAEVVGPKDDPFYGAPDPMPAVEPGTVLRSREVTIAALGAPLPFRAWQLFYASSDAHGRPAGAVTTVILPLTEATTKPRPLVS